MRGSVTSKKPLTISRRLKLPKISWLWLAIWLGSFAGCKTGPLVTACIVDCLDRTLRCDCLCIDPEGKSETRPIERCDSYVAFSPQDTERLLKACKGATKRAYGVEYNNLDFLLERP